MASRIIAVPLCPGLPSAQPWHRSSGQGQHPSSHLTSPHTSLLTSYKDIPPRSVTIRPRRKSLRFQHMTSLSTRRLPCGLPSPSHGAQPGEVRTPIPVSEWQALLVLLLCVLNFTSTNDPLDQKNDPLCIQDGKTHYSDEMYRQQDGSDGSIAQQARLPRTGLKPPRGAGRRKVRLSDMASVTAATQKEPLPLCFDI